MAAPAVPVVAALVAAAGAFAAGVAALAHGGRRARTEDALLAAERLGWRHRDEVPFDALPDLNRFELFRRGRSKRIRNVLTSPPGGPRVVLFDYRFVTGGGNSQRTHRQTVCYVVDDRLSLPSFSLRPETVLHKVAGAFGYHDIDLDASPEFSRRFLLRGQDHRRIRALFAEPVTAFFEARPGVCAAGVGREVLYWRLRGFTAAREIPALIEDALALVEGLASAGEGATA